MAMGMRGLLRQIRAGMGRHSLEGRLYAGGPNQVSSSDHVRVMLEMPGSSSKVALVTRAIMAHDSSGILPAEIIRNPDTNTPTTVIDSLNLAMHHTNTSEATMYADSGLDMTGSAGGLFLPTIGDFPLDVELRAPFVVMPGTAIGLDFDVGGNLTSGSVMCVLAWIERETSAL